MNRDEWISLCIICIMIIAAGYIIGEYFSMQDECYASPLTFGAKQYEDHYKTRTYGSIHVGDLFFQFNGTDIRGTSLK